jgi:hypothetical protein
MRLDRLVSIASFALVSVVAAACGDDGAPQFIDASIPDAEPPPPDAPACSGSTPDQCDFGCVNFEEDEATCGDCDTACTGGQYCNSGTCECPPAFVPLSPGFGIQQVNDTQVPGLVIGFGVFNNSGNHALATVYEAAETAVDMDYLFDEDPQSMPVFGAGYNVALQGQMPTFDAAFAATEGTIRFTEICDGGFAGFATDVTFSGVESLFNPVIIPGGCEFMVTGQIDFSYGTDCSP